MQRWRCHRRLNFSGKEKAFVWNNNDRFRHLYFPQSYCHLFVSFRVQHNILHVRARLHCAGTVPISTVRTSLRFNYTHSSGSESFKIQNWPLTFWTPSQNMRRAPAINESMSWNKQTLVSNVSRILRNFIVIVTAKCPLWNLQVPLITFSIIYWGYCEQALSCQETSTQVMYTRGVGFLSESALFVLSLCLCAGAAAVSAECGCHKALGSMRPGMFHLISSTSPVSRGGERRQPGETWQPAEQSWLTPCLPQGSALCLALPGFVCEHVKQWKPGGWQIH